MPPADYLQVLYDIGGWVFACAVLAWQLWRFTSGHLVSKATNDREIARGDLMGGKIDLLTEAVRDLATVVRESSAERERRGVADERRDRGSR